MGLLSRWQTVAFSRAWFLEEKVEATACSEERVSIDESPPTTSIAHVVDILRNLQLKASEIPANKTQVKDDRHTTYLEGSLLRIPTESPQRLDFSAKLTSRRRCLWTRGLEQNLRRAKSDLPVIGQLAPCDLQTVPGGAFNVLPQALQRNTHKLRHLQLRRLRCPGTRDRKWPPISCQVWSQDVCHHWFSRSKLHRKIITRLGDHPPRVTTTQLSSWKWRSNIRTSVSFSPPFCISENVSYANETSSASALPHFDSIFNEKNRLRLLIKQQKSF